MARETRAAATSPMETASPCRKRFRVLRFERMRHRVAEIQQSALSASFVFVSRHNASLVPGTGRDYLFEGAQGAGLDAFLVRLKLIKRQLSAYPGVLDNLGEGRNVLARRQCARSRSQITARGCQKAPIRFFQTCD